MRKYALLAVLVCCCSLAALPSAQPPAAPVPEGMQRVHLGDHNFTLPVGFTIELVAAAPLVDRPIVADFDEQGRLYVADSSGTNTRSRFARQAASWIVRHDDTKRSSR